MRAADLRAARLAAQEVLDPLEPWAHQCHAASVHLMRSGRFGECRVARGGCKGVPGQHSWLVLGMDCYAKDVLVVDGTLWSYDPTVEGIWVGMAGVKHHPHGEGSIFAWGRPDRAKGPVVTLTPRKPLSAAAEAFLSLLGPLDREGWAVLAHAPVGDWPAGEIYEAMLDTPGLGHLIPIDLVGMNTLRNPSGLYLPLAEEEAA